MDHQAIADTQDLYTRINKKDLLEEIQANSLKHSKEFSDAFQGWRVAIAKAAAEYIEDFGTRLTNFEEKEEPTFSVIYPNQLPTPPTNHTSDYQRIIRRFEMSLDETIFLSHDDFDKFVLDQWDWSRDHATSQALYNSSR